MSKQTLLFFFLISILLFSCQKNIVKADKQSNPNYLASVDYLTSRKRISSGREAERIAAIRENLVDQAPQKIRFDNYEIWFFDLVHYRNQRLPGYANTYYKAYFTLLNGKIIDGLVLTVHSDQEKVVINENLPKAFLGQEHIFSGMIVTNLLNNRFMKADSYQSGKLDKQYQLKNGTNPVDANSPPTAQTNPDDCVYYYLVTTTLYADGHTETEVTYLYKLCGDCVPEGQPVAYLVPDCGDGSGGGGGGGNEASISTFVEGRSEDVDDYLPVAPPVKYIHRAEFLKVNDAITHVQIYQTLIENPSGKYMDGSGRFVGRLLTTLAHYNTYSLVTSRSVLLNWSCQVHGRYTYYDGTPTYTRQWAHIHSEVRS